MYKFKTFLPPAVGAPPETPLGLRPRPRWSSMLGTPSLVRDDRIIKVEKRRCVKLGPKLWPPKDTVT